jgi:hypothetical protein
MTDAAYARAESMLMNMWTDVFGSVGKRTTGTSSGNFLSQSRQVRDFRVDGVSANANRAATVYARSGATLLGRIPFYQ